MKSFLILSLLVVSFSSFSASAGEKYGTKKNDKKILVSQPEVKKDTTAAPCQQTQEEIMKQLEEKQKAQSKASSEGKSLGLQGLGTPGCAVK